MFDLIDNTMSHPRLNKRSDSLLVPAKPSYTSASPRNIHQTTLYLQSNNPQQQQLLQQHHHLQSHSNITESSMHLQPTNNNQFQHHLQNHHLSASSHSPLHHLKAGTPISMRHQQFVDSASRGININVSFEHDERVYPIDLDELDCQAHRATKPFPVRRGSPNHATSSWLTASTAVSSSPASSSSSIQHRQHHHQQHQQQQQPANQTARLKSPSLQRAHSTASGATYQQQKQQPQVNTGQTSTMHRKKSTDVNMSPRSSFSPENSTSNSKMIRMRQQTQLDCGGGDPMASGDRKRPPLIRQSFTVTNPSQEDLPNDSGLLPGSNQPSSVSLSGSINSLSPAKQLLALQRNSSLAISHAGIGAGGEAEEGGGALVGRVGGPTQHANDECNDTSTVTARAAAGGRTRSSISGSQTRMMQYLTVDMLQMHHPTSSAACSASQSSGFTSGSVSPGNISNEENRKLSQQLQLPATHPNMWQIGRSHSCAIDNAGDDMTMMQMMSMVASERGDEMRGGTAIDVVNAPTITPVDVQHNNNIDKQATDDANNNNNNNNNIHKYGAIIAPAQQRRISSFDEQVSNAKRNSFSRTTTIAGQSEEAISYSHAEVGRASRDAADCGAAASPTDHIRRKDSNQIMSAHKYSCGASPIHLSIHSMPTSPLPMRVAGGGEGGGVGGGGGGGGGRDRLTLGQSNEEEMPSHESGSDLAFKKHRVHPQITRCASTAVEHGQTASSSSSRRSSHAARPASKKRSQDHHHHHHHHEDQDQEAANDSIIINASGAATSSSRFKSLQKAKDFFKLFSTTRQVQKDEPDPVYHLLKCAAAMNPDHNPLECKCPCHGEVPYDSPNSSLSPLPKPKGRQKLFNMLKF